MWLHNLCIVETMLSPCTLQKNLRVTVRCTSNYKELKLLGNNNNYSVSLAETVILLIYSMCVWYSYDPSSCYVAWSRSWIRCLILGLILVFPLKLVFPVKSWDFSQIVASCRGVILTEINFKKFLRAHQCRNFQKEN